MTSHVRLVFSLFTRMVGVSFVLIAAAAIPQARKYLDSEIVVEDDVIFMPLFVCTPGSIDLNGQMINFDNSNGKKCHTMSYLANNCIMSLVLAIVAFGFFAMADFSAYRGTSRIPGAVVGMGLFLVFILLQTAVSALALGGESRYWETYYQDMLAQSRTVQSYYDEVLGGAYSDVSQYREIRMHGSTMMTIATGAMALFCAIFLFVETVLMYCWPYDSSDPSREVTGKTVSAPTPLWMKEEFNPEMLGVISERPTMPGREKSTAFLGYDSDA